MRLKLTNNKSSKKFWLTLGRRQFFIAMYKRPVILTQGITNETQDGMYVPFIDYDQINQEKVIQEAKRLIRLWNFSGFVILATSEELTKDGMAYGNYHLVGFDKIRYHDHLDMLYDTCCDRNFIKVPRFFRFKHWVLRIAPKCDEKTWSVLKKKPYIIGWIPGEQSGRYEQSYGHYEFMRKYYGLKPLKLSWDKATAIQMIRYNTTHR